MFNLREDVIGAWHQGFSPEEIALDQDVEIETVYAILAEYKRRVRELARRDK